jgi:hypothetical protein
MSCRLCPLWQFGRHQARFDDGASENVAQQLELVRNQNGFRGYMLSGSSTKTAKTIEPTLIILIYYAVIGASAWTMKAQRYTKANRRVEMKTHRPTCGRKCLPDVFLDARDTLLTANS